MKHLSLITLLFFISLFASSQKTGTWNTSSIFDPANSKIFLQKIDSTIFTGSDLQIRLWFSNGWSRINIMSFLCLLKKNETWSATYFTFSKGAFAHDSATVINQKQTRQLNIDSLYKELKKDSLFLIRSDTIGKLLDDQGNHRWSWTDGGPTTYLIEIITPAKSWSLRYPCPKYFYDTYKFSALRIPLKIISTLMFLIGLDPC